MAEAKTEHVTLSLCPSDRELLNQLAALDYDDNCSLAIRMLIREQADRRGIVREESNR